MKQTNKKTKKHSIRKRVVSVLAAFVVFVTTYSLILPAITIEQDVAENEPGIYLADTQVESVPVEESEGVETPAEEPTEERVAESAEESAAEPAEEPIQESVEEPVEELTEEIALPEPEEESIPQGDLTADLARALAFT